MKQEEHNKKREELDELEGKLIEKAAEIGDLEFMDLFLNWQTLRAELNENSVKMMEELLSEAEEENEEMDGIGIEFQLKHKMCLTCEYGGHIKSVHPCYYCTKKSRYKKGSKF